MKQRKLTINYLNVLDSKKRCPLIRLHVRWLESLGFAVGAKVTVITDERIIVIVPRREMTASDPCMNQLRLGINSIPSLFCAHLNETMICAISTYHHFLIQVAYQENRDVLKQKPDVMVVPCTGLLSEVVGTANKVANLKMHCCAGRRPDAISAGTT